MKKTKKFLMLVPVLGLFLSGCSFKEVKHSIGESWIGQHILHPIYDPIRDLINGGKKEEQKTGGDVTPSGEDTPTGGDTPSGGDTPVGPAFPSDKVDAYTSSLGATDKVPAFSGKAISYTFYDDEGVLDIEVGEEKVAASLTTFFSDLTKAHYTEAGQDDYGDMHYLSPNAQLDISAWDAAEASTPAPGHIYVVIAKAPEVLTSFPLEKVNKFLTDNEFSLQFTQADADAISALASQFAVSEGESTFGNYMLIGFEGDFQTQLDTILSSTLTTAGYEKNSQATYPYYSNDDDMSVSFWTEEGVTTIQLY